MRAESDGGMGQPNLNSISPRISIKEQYFKSMAQPGGNEITRWKICITGEALCLGAGFQWSESTSRQACLAVLRIEWP